MYFAIAAFTFLLGYGALQQGAVIVFDSMIVTGGIGLLVTVSSAFFARHRSPSRSGLVVSLMGLSLALVVFQLVQLPPGWLQVLSPSRAGIAASLDSGAWAPITLVPAQSRIWLIRMAGCFLALVLARDLTWRFREAPWVLVTPVLVVAGGQAILGCVQFFLGGPGTVARGTYVDRDHFSGLLEMAIPLAVMMAVAIYHHGKKRFETSGRSAVYACALLALAAIMLVAVIFSLSRMGFLAVLASLFFVGTVSSSSALSNRLDPRFRWLPVGLVGLLVVLAFVYLPTDELIARFASIGNQELSADTRAKIWRESMPLITSAKWFGSGIGSYESAFYRFKHVEPMLSVGHAHNDYIQAIVELGILGFLPIAILAILAVKGSLEGAALPAETAQHYLGIGCAGSLAALFLHSIVDFNLYIPANALTVSWISGIALGVGLSAKRSRSKSARFPLMLSGLLVTAGSVGILAGDGRIPSPDSLRDWLIGHDWSSEGVVEWQARNASLSPEPADRSRAIEIDRTLVRRDPANPYRWCDLAEALQEAGEPDKACRAFARASALGPNIPPTLIRAANFYYAKGDKDAALPLYRAVLGLVHDYDPIIFLISGRLGLTPADIVKMLPVSKETGRNYLQFAMNQRNVQAASTAWSWLRANSLTDDAVAANYVDFLLRQKLADTAAAVWADYSGANRGDYLRPNAVFNGSFEHEPIACRLDWRIQSIEGTETILDPDLAATGSHSLRIRFAGQSNLAFNHVSQTVSLEPGTYRFRAKVRTEDITTNEGIRFRLSDPNTHLLDWVSEGVVGTHPWFTVEETVTVPQCPFVELEIIRRPSEKFDNKIQGTIWIDEVSLTRM